MQGHPANQVWADSCKRPFEPWPHICRLHLVMFDRDSAAKTLVKIRKKHSGWRICTIASCRLDSRLGLRVSSIEGRAGHTTYRILLSFTFATALRGQTAVLDISRFPERHHFNSEHVETWIPPCGVWMFGSLCLVQNLHSRSLRV